MSTATAQIIPYPPQNGSTAMQDDDPRKGEGGNFAPKRELDELKRNGKTSAPSKICEALLNKYQDYKQRDTETWQEYYNIGRMVSNLRTGKLLLMRSITDGRYLFVKREGRFSDNKTVGGKFQFYSTKLLAEWLSSQPERDPICPSDDDQIEAFISNVKIVQDYYDKHFFTDQYETNESLSAQDYGTWITYFRYDPHCQDIVCELLDFPACRWDIRFTAEESSYFIYESKCSNAVLEHLLNADIAEDGDGYDNYGLELIEQIAKAGGNVAGEGKDNPFGNANNVAGENVVTQMWLQPEAYCDVEIDEDTPTLGGKKIKKGRLVDTFPDGLVAVGINGMQTILYLYPENHKDHIVSGRFHVQSFSGVGKGISDAVDVKKEMDDLHSQTMAYIKAHSTPATYYNQDMITEDQARNIGKPRKVIPVDFSNAPDGVNSINQAIQVVTPQNPANSIFEYQEILNNWLQLSMGVTDFSNGLPGVDNTTATGAKIGDANAAMVLVPQHRNKADHRRRADKVIYNLFKKFVNKKKFFQTRSKNGITAGTYLTGSQFEGVDIDFEIVANSEVPQTPYQQRENLTQLLNFTGGIGGLIEAAQMNPDITGEISTAFGVKNLSIPNKVDIARICRRRIEQAKKILEAELANQKIMAAVGFPADNTNLAEQVVSQLSPPISPYEQFAQQKSAWMSELLDSDEMQFAPIELRYVVETLIDHQLEAQAIGQAKVEQDSNLGYAMSQLPTILGENALNQSNMALEHSFQMEQQAQQQQMQAQQAQAQAQAQGQQQGQQLQQQVEANGAEQQQDLQSQLASTAIEQKAAQDDHDRNLTQEQVTHRNQMQQKQLEHKNKMQQLAVQSKMKAQANKAKPAAKK